MSSSSSTSLTSSSSSATTSSITSISSLSSVSSISLSTRSSISSSLSSSSSTGSSLSSSTSSNSSSSTLSLSSTSIDSNSSSSTSYLDYSEDRLLPFSFTYNKSKLIRSLTYYGETIFAGTSEDGMVIYSTNKYNWGNFYQTDDFGVSSVYVKSKNLFMGTYPLGKIYKMDLSTYNVTYYGSFNGMVIGFVELKRQLYAFTTSPSNVYKYNLENDRWDIFYKPYTDEIYQIKLLHSKIYLVGRGENVISFDGDKWLLEVNTAAYRNIETNVFSHVDFNFIEKSKIINTENMSQEAILDVFPYNRSIGIRSLTYDNNALLLGSSNRGRIYGLYNEILSVLFDTEGNFVYDMINIDTGVNLASIDNKIYLISCGNTSTATNTNVVEDESSSQSNPDKNKNIIITSPDGNEIFALGSTITITWSSNKSLNDSIKLSLYKGGTENLIINSKTSNTGTYDWETPLSLEIGNDYQIYVEWLSASTATNDNKDLSNGYFSLLNTLPSESSQSVAIEEEQGTYSTNCYGIPILELPLDEYVCYMTKDDDEGIIFTTSNGRILSCSKKNFNAYLTGDRSVYAIIWDGFGNKSDTSITNFMYALYKKIVEITEDKEIIKNKFISSAVASPCDNISAIFLSPLLYVKQDMGLWKELIWQETKPSNTRIIICVRTGTTEDDIKTQPWENCFQSTAAESGTITRELNNINLYGQYMQLKVEMRTDLADVNPVIANVSIKYSTNKAYYFFTTKFSLDKESDIKNGIIVANMTKPINTEIKFGIVENNSADWNDYETIETDKLFDITDYKNLKVGIKLISYDTHVPEVDEFAIMWGDNLKQVTT